MARVDTNPLTQPLIPNPPWQSGRYYLVGGQSNTATSAALGNATLRAYPFSVPNQVTLSRVGAEVTGAGDAGSKLRLGIYNDDGTGQPGTLVLDAGTIAGDSVAVQEIVIAQALGPGLYWAAAVVQLVTVTQPTVRTIANQLAPVASSLVTPGAAAAGLGAATQAATVVGALPSPFPAFNFGTGSVARVFVKVA